MFKLNSRVRYSEVDQKGNLTIVALINYLQDCSSFESDALSLGLNFVSEHGWGWFITNWEIHIHSLPKYGDNIVVSTWPVSINGVLCNRDFCIDDEQGNRLVEAKSLWILMDLKQRRPVRMPEDMKKAYQGSEGLAGQWQGRRIALFKDEQEVEGRTIQVMPVHLDTNMHMNNAYYIEIARDILPKDKKIFQIRTEYKKSAELSDEIHIFISTHEDLTQVVLRDDTGRVYAIIEFMTD